MAAPTGLTRIELAAAGLLGFAGVAAAAAGAHLDGGSGLMGAVGLVCLTHAAAVLALALHGRGGFVLHLATRALIAGTALFSVDLTLVAFGHGRLFPMAAPSGGITMMAGWLALVLAAFMPQRN
jgi:uncharacterized membrane protein YgdD (TMEM256/DUF423 family)